MTLSLNGCKLKTLSQKVCKLKCQALIYNLSLFLKININRFITKLQLVHFWQSLLKRDTQPTLRHHDSRPPRFHAYRIPKFFFPLPSFDSAQDDKGGEISNKEIKQAPFRVGGNLFYFNYSKQLFRIFHLVTHHQLYDFTNSQIHDSQLYDFTTSHLASHISDLGS